MSRKCLLNCTRSLSSPLQLPHLQEIFLGRSEKTNIDDPDCSKKQMSFVADCTRCVVLVKNEGRNLSGINGYAMKNGVPIEAVHGDRIELLLGKYEYILKFEPPPDAEKRPLSNGSHAVEKKIKLESDNSLAIENSFEKIDNGALYIYTSGAIKSRSKVAAYDIDGTIIKTKSGLVFPKNIDDWQFAFAEVPGKLKQLHADGFKIVFFTNQASIGNGKLKPDDFKIKLQNIIKKLGVPVQAFISSGKGKFRKPLSGMWETFTEMKNDNIDVDMDASFYCGDAAGRKGDHSLSDRLFAKNIELPFCTPEAHFCNRAESSYTKPSFDPNELLQSKMDEQDLLADNQEILIFVGYPGSGKSFISKTIENKSKYKYKIVCRDTLGSFEKCQSEAEKALKNQKSVIVDSTNPDIESRARWVNIAKRYNLPCRCLKMDVSFEHAKHNNKFRQLTDSTHSFVGDMVFNTYKKKYVEPKLEEGFQEIVNVKFIPKFEDPKKHKLYGKYMLEK